jgi:hypothetical protein
MRKGKGGGRYYVAGVAFVMLYYPIIAQRRIAVASEVTIHVIQSIANSMMIILYLYTLSDFHPLKHADGLFCLNTGGFCLTFIFRNLLGGGGGLQPPQPPL